MKKLTASLVIVLFTLTALAQNQANKTDGVKTERTESSTYRLFPTVNMWTFIKLNTRTGQMWQVQYDVKENNRGEYRLNPLSLVTKEEETNGRFILYPTQNSYNFILLDQLDGGLWQVQWSIEPEKRLLLKMN
ncbi:hypothetical protein [Mucilaginibacter sp.]|uniref:hypothetical protein n=1 Tax=Mucilaginibacter sp. TaxID=1882438 RepID=UPI002630E999|nr:hypothetical protein [Mucilaginibacter sp.]MDB5126012.1 hypothetical protein [Mucilaginibacter sp.]